MSPKKQRSGGTGGKYEQKSVCNSGRPSLSPIFICSRGYSTPITITLGHAFDECLKLIQLFITQLGQIPIEVDGVLGLSKGKVP